MARLLEAIPSFNPLLQLIFHLFLNGSVPSLLVLILYFQANAMQTVKFNRRAVLTLVGLLFLFLCIFSYLPSGTVDPPRVVRDLRNRPPVIKPEPHENVEEQDEKEPKPVVGKVKAEIKTVPIAAEEQGETDEEDAKRREFVKGMMLHAWNGYRNYSWGFNELKPVAKTHNSQGIFGGKEMPATIVDAADTLWIMGLENEYKQARDYIKDNMSMSKATGTLSVFETTIRFLGGLLSLYALTKEEFYIAKARAVGEALLPAFNTPSGIPKSNLDVTTKYASNYGWANGASSILAEYGSLHLEFVYLSHVAKAPIFAKKVKKIRDVLDKAEKVKGLYPNYISPDTGRFVPTYHISLGALGDSFYEYLIKSWLQTNKTDEQSRKMYWDTAEAIKKEMVFKSKSGLTYVAELRGGQVDHKMGHLACFCVGMFALQAVNEKSDEKRKETMELAEELGKTCHESYIRTDSRIGPEMFYFSASDDATSKHGENGYIQRPEVLEGFFYLWRLTEKPMYKEWVWDAIQAIEKHCRVEGGYAGLRNVYNPKGGYDDVQQSFFLAETLKYAYLTFTDNSVISLDEWVFNTEAHPLPVMTKVEL